MSVSARRCRITDLTGLPQNWQGPLPDVSVRRTLATLPGSVQLPRELLHGGHADLAVLTWAWLRLRSNDRGEVASYQQFADGLGYAHLTTRAVQKRFSAALRSLLDEGASSGRWLERGRTFDNQQLYRAVVPSSAGDEFAVLRRADFARLAMSAEAGQARAVAVGDLTDFARWQLECGCRGWTADALSVIATRWSVSEPTLSRSRRRLAARGLLKITKRPGQYTDLVWLAELHDPMHDPNFAFRVDLPRQPTSSIARPGAEVVGPVEDRADPLTGLRSGWWARRVSAVHRLHAGLSKLSVDDAWWRPHEVYLIHFPDESRYKVGLTLVSSQRIAHLTANRASVVVDRIAVGNRFVAEMVEVDVLTAVEPWHELGDPLCKAGGYTEMWSDTGPSIDLVSFAAAATSEIARLLTSIEVTL